MNADPTVMTKPGIAWHLRRWGKRLVPGGLLNRTFLSAPILYRLPFINYESNLGECEVSFLLELVEETADLPGAIVECGTSRGGSAILMARHLHALGGATKRVFAVDSFRGFDLAELETERSEGLVLGISDDAFTSTSSEYVRRKVAKLGLADTITVLEGYFEDVLPGMGGGAETPVSLAFIDCDLRQSMTYCAETLWPRVVPGGVIVFHDFHAHHFRGARLAVEEFVRHAGVASDSHGHRQGLYWVRRTA